MTLVLEPMDYAFLAQPDDQKESLRKGSFSANDHGTPYAGIRKNFAKGETWNPHMMDDPYIDNTHSETVENPNLSEKQRLAVMKKLAVYALDQAPCILTSYPLHLLCLVALGQELLRGTACSGTAIRSDSGPHLDRSGDEEENGVLNLIQFEISPHARLRRESRTNDKFN